ncbi:MAG TPA: hypothetical protein VK171_03230, partial [Fimbriimonas sp.]|nr:hypothetical protein [Fimbriimonas sp.]
MDKESRDPISLDEVGFGIGTFEIEEATIPLSKHGTVIIADEPYPSFTAALRESVRESYTEMPRTWSKFIKIIQSHRNVQELGDYWKLIFDLGIACPVPYGATNALPGGYASDFNRKFEDYNFELFVDGKKIFKPILFDVTAPDAYSFTKINEETSQIRVSGYLLGQNGTQIKPAELRGVIIRIKEVGIGVYDRTFLDYRENEGPRTNWITGELFVEIGLEDALNIDRDSFNRFHPDYRYISTLVHTQLQQGLMSELNKKQGERSAHSREKKEQQKRVALQKLMSSIHYED